MSQVNTLTYQVALTPENAGKIDAINKILLGSAMTESAPVKVPEVKKAAPEKAAPEKAAPVTSGSTSGASETSGTSIDDLKSAAKAAKAAHSEKFVKEMIEKIGITPLASLGRCMGKIPEDQYDEIIALWKAGPSEIPVVDDGMDDLDDDLGDDLDDDLGDEAPTPEAVKLALKAMSQGGDRAGAKEIMEANGAKKLSDVDNCTPAQLSAMFAKLV